MRPNLRIINKKLQRSRSRKSSKSCQNYERMMKTLLLQNQQIIIQQQNMMFMVMKQFHNPQASHEQQQQRQHQQQQPTAGITSPHHMTTQPSRSTDPGLTQHQHNIIQAQLQLQQQQHAQLEQQQQQQAQQQQQQHEQQTPTQIPSQQQQCMESYAVFMTPVASEQDPISDTSKPDDDISALLDGDDLLTSNLLYNPQTDIGQITPYKNQQQQQHQETPSYYNSGGELLTTPRVEQPRQSATTTSINQNVVKNLADSFKSPTKPKINVQILSGSATRNMKNNKAKIIQRMNISEFLRHVHQDDQATHHQQPVKTSASQ